MKIRHATPEPLLDSEGAGRILGYTPRQVCNLVALGTLPVVRLPGTRAFRFRPESIRQLLEDCETFAKPVASNEAV